MGQIGITRKPWTTSEDFKLTQALVNCTNITTVIGTIARQLGRTEMSCMVRWYRIKRGDVPYMAFPVSKKEEVSTSKTTNNTETSTTSNSDVRDCNEEIRELEKGILIPEKVLAQLPLKNLKALVLNGLSHENTITEKELLQILKTIYETKSITRGR